MGPVPHVEVVVVGGGAAGMSAASRVKRIHKDWTVRVFEASGYVSYAPCGLPYFIVGKVKEPDDLVYYPVEVFREKRGIDVHTHAKVVDADYHKRTVTVIENGEKKEYKWDKLILATGARPKSLGVEGEDLRGVIKLHTVESGIAAREELKDAKEVVVVGAGFTGVEVAAELRDSEREVHLVVRSRALRKSLDPEMSELVEEHLKNVGIRLHKGVTVTKILGKDRVEGVELSDGEVIKAQAVVVAVGVEPNAELAKRLGVKLGKFGGIKVNEYMETNLPDVYAAGDVAESWLVHTGTEAWCPFAPPANKMGLVAGLSASGKRVPFPGVACTGITVASGLEIGRTGLTEEEAKALGFKVKSSFVKARTRAHYYPGSQFTHVKLVAAEDGTVLGVQVVGPEGVKGRVDAVATLLTKRGTVRDLFFSDIGYVPPLAPVWDPLVTAARLLYSELR
ncbi:FAD-dependent pyridine nucleotide-disulphide oxidoreductase [Ignicoccus hospitalis KIN4/I]|uniref:FAD-dependent pyridine nucleotide-disulphide oxidoreductase n=1 Tax=Ignicoccus hospitalis (strain KIN4/I / DSM 18386 / JCM 14125) TaxID=453591 RepID=A8AAA1_IGNH4|nr:FAD-dependent pyridine nucleotide-disulphide oxidoreductase [Ignicoccus hospitalis KIN4/I]